MNRRKISTEALSRAAQVAPPPPDRAWHALANRLDERRRVRRVRKLVAVPALLAFAGAAALALHWQQRPAAPMMARGQTIESAGVALRLTLPDGIEAELRPTSRISVETMTPEEMHVTLSRGSARFRVEHRGGRQLSVDVDSMSAVVVGTQFEVARVDGADGTRMEVMVERGVVEVRSRDGRTEPRRLHAGDRFSSLLSAPPAANGAGGVAVADPHVPAFGTRAAVGVETDARAGRVTVASAGHGVAGGARLLLERAQQQWRSGNLGEAAKLYQEVLRRHPRDPRVGLAALELGRLRMDRLGDLEGALVSFRRAVRQAGGAAVHEDALARLVEVAATLGYAAECAQARDNYLRRYPAGIHAAAVTDRCARPEAPRP